MSRDELSFLGPAQTDTLAGLVMDLAAQLHIERQRRMALEEVLARAGLIDREAIEALAGDQDFLGAAREALDRSMGRLIAIIAEAGDRTGPLRGEAPPAETTDATKGD